jgi:hypothetical protein
MGWVNPSIEGVVCKAGDCSGGTSSNEVVHSKRVTAYVPALSVAAWPHACAGDYVWYIPNGWQSRQGAEGLVADKKLSQHCNIDA